MRPPIRLGARTLTLTREPTVGDVLDLQPLLTRLNDDDGSVVPELLEFLVGALGVTAKELKTLTWTELGETLADFANWTQTPATSRTEPKRQTPARSPSKSRGR